MFDAGGMSGVNPTPKALSQCRNPGRLSAGYVPVRGGERQVMGTKRLRFISLHFPLPNKVDGLGYETGQACFIVPMGKPKVQCLGEIWKFIRPG